MKVILDNLCLHRGDWSLSAAGIFSEGIHLVSGNTGSGKTTLARMLAGLLEPSSGSVHRESVNSLMVSFQFPEYHVTGATVDDECQTWGVDPLIVLRKINLAEQAGLSPLRLSRGELKRLHLTCVMAREYDLLILDEPFSSLDCREKDRICREISHRTKGITIIFTHEQEQFPRVDSLWEIEDGTLFCRGRLPDALLTWKHAPEIVKRLITRGKIPGNLTRADFMEAACRT